MRSTSKTSNPGERGLFRLLVGAALALAVWREFWKWALPKPKRGALNTWMATEILKDHYMDAIRGALFDTSRMFNRYLYGTPPPPTIEQYVQRRVKLDPLPHEVAWARIKQKLRPYKPILMTQRKKEDLEYYD